MIMTFSLNYSRAQVPCEVEQVTRSSASCFKGFLILYALMDSLFWFNIPDKKRNAPLRTVQPAGIKQVIGQFSLHQCKGMSCTVASHVFCNLASKLCGGQIVKSQEISVFIMLSCWISSSNWNTLSRPNCTQTLILGKFCL